MSECMFESVKASLLGIVPYERDIHFEKARERRRNGCKVSDECTVITRKTEERTQVVY